MRPRVCEGAAAAVGLQLSWEQRASPISWPFVSVSPPPPLTGRSGGAFVTGEPLIKFPSPPLTLLLEPGGTVVVVELRVVGLSDS